MCTPDCLVCPVHTNAVAVTSVALEETRNALRRFLAGALDHGLTVHDLAVASGRSEDFITNLMEEATL